MSDEHVSYKANLQTASTKSRARFLDGVFWQAESGLLLRAYWELVDQFLSLHDLFAYPSYGEMPHEIERL